MVRWENRWWRAGAVACGILSASGAAVARGGRVGVGPAPRPALVIVAVLDGLRPDAITPGDTPTLWRLQREGVRFTNTHAAFPTLTRVNGAVFQTGTYPGTNGLVSNSLYVPGVDSAGLLDTGNGALLLHVDSVSGGHLLDRVTLSERLARAGVPYAAVSTGSTGNAMMQNLYAGFGGSRGASSVLVDSGFGAGRVAYPAWFSDTVVARVGKPPTVDANGGLVALVEWTGRVAREVVMPVVRPRVLVYWQTEPDQSQHVLGLGSPAARVALRAADRQLGMLLESLGGRRDSTDVMVVSDHGFVHVGSQVNVQQAVIDAGLKASARSSDVVVGAEGQAVSFYMKGRDSARVRAVAAWVGRQPWAGVVFTRGRRSGDTTGWVSGTVSLDVLHLQHGARGPDVEVTLPWNADTNVYGFAGSATGAAVAGVTGPIAGVGDSHGGLTPYTVHSTMIAWGPDFRRGVVDSVPVGNVDVAPTVLALLGFRTGPGEIEGRVLGEALAHGAALRAPVVEHDTIVVRAANGRVMRVARQRVDGSVWYVDAGWVGH